MNESTNDWTEVHTALHKFFSERPQRDAMLDRVNTQEDLEALQVVEDAAKLLPRYISNIHTLEY